MGQVREKIAEKNLSIAGWYAARGKPGAARFYYQFTVDRFGDTQAAEQARFSLGAEGEDK